MLYVVDTETNGLPTSFYPAYQDVEKWPRMQSIAFQTVHEASGTSPTEIIVNADFDIDPVATSIHGITQEISREKGVPVVKAIQDFADTIRNDPSPVLCAYNANFDKGIM